MKQQYRNNVSFSQKGNQYTVTFRTGSVTTTNKARAERLFASLKG